MISPENQNFPPLSLHEVTRQYGEEGLIDRFEYEIGLLDISPEDRDRIMEANRLQLHAHAEQPRGDYGYTTHTLRVAIRVIHYFEVSDPDIIIAALLHDSVEDQSGRINHHLGLSDDPTKVDKPLALSAIRDKFGDRVADIVSAVTNPEFDESLDRHQQYRDYVVEALSATPAARVIKLSDFVDNCTGIIHNESPTLALKLARKYGPLIPAMRIFTNMSDTPLSPDARRYVLRQLKKAEVRCQELLAA